MIYINNNTVEVIIPKTNTEYIQNRIVVTNQISKYSYEYHLTDFSTDNDCYIFKRPSFNCDDYIGSYDYQIFYNDILLDNGILLVEGLQPTGTTDKIEYEYKQTVIEYTPSIEYYPIVDRVKTITENGDYNVENYDSVKVNVLGGEVTDDEVNVLLEQLNALEAEKTLLEGQILELNREIEELSNTNATLSTENATLLAEKQQLLAQVKELMKSIEAQITDLNNRISELQNDNAILENDLSNANNTIADLQDKVNSVTSITINEEGTYIAPEGILGWNKVVVDMKDPEEPFVPEYLKFETNGVGYVLYVTDGTLSPNLEVSRDGVNFSPYGILGGRYSIEGDKPLYIRGVNNAQISDINNHFAFSIPNSNHRIYVSGNIMSLVDGEGRTKVIPDDNMFSYLFANEDQGEYIYFGDLTLPATTLTKGCYKGMFSNTKTKSVPRTLPATTLQDECYESMFEGTDIFNSPYIMGEYLKKDCLKRTFYGAGLLEHAFIFAKNLYNADYYWGDGEELQIDMDNCAYECFLLAGSTLIDDCNCDHKTPRTYLLCSEQMECEWNTYDYHKNMGIFITSLPQSLINNIIQ